MVLIAFPVRNLINLLIVSCCFVGFFLVGDCWVVCGGSIRGNWHEVAVLD